jgi:hypothetical protein
VKGIKMRVRNHRGFGHGLNPGTDHDMNCPSCQREREQGVAPDITPPLDVFDVTVTTTGGAVYYYQVQAASPAAARWAASSRFVTGHRSETDGAVLSDAAPSPVQGPLCDSMEWEGHCGHPACHVIDDTLPDLAECPTHGPQQITGGDTFSGYAGGRCWSLHLACGCTVVDESGDVAAAR